MRRLALMLPVALALGACGATPASHSEPRVRVKISGPVEGGTVRSQTVVVTGTVTPADSAVAVAGADADVSGGSFKATVSLQPGGNVIDVTATSPGRRAAVEAVRVARDISVQIPTLVGLSQDDAAQALQKLGLAGDAQRVGSFLDSFYPAELKVCDSQPEAGVLVQPHTRVTLMIARHC